MPHMNINTAIFLEIFAGCIFMHFFMKMK
uniref:ATPase subunit 8 n=1 Tax=Clavelina oblonga TaxID=286222 RepID=A0A024FSA0_9ASCI|nr:ATP synthase F0 subunit 8 [Clavelina oblonga]CAL24386.1 ATPase subunit 8 [Clavelina oblonga]